MHWHCIQTSSMSSCHLLVMQEPGVSLTTFGLQDLSSSKALVRVEGKPAAKQPDLLPDEAGDSFLVVQMMQKEG